MVNERDELEEMMKEAEVALQKAKDGLFILKEAGEITLKEEAEIRDAEKRLKAYRNGLDKLRKQGK